jgi:DNA polymerase-3 subunit epsilon/CBS domain-containing protein
MSEAGPGGEEIEDLAVFSSPSTPLSLLSAVVVDTETTSIDPREARIVQIGALRLSKGKIDEARIFNRLVNPQIPVPAASSRVHGLTSADLKDAPKFSEIVADFERYVKGRFFIGHAIAFDLMVFKREYALIRRRWIEARAVDIRPLARAIAPALPDYSLDAMAASLGIEIEDRHTALGDARATAAIFKKLVPLLKQQGVRTVAEAIEFARGGEATFGRNHAPGSPESGPIARIDTFSFRHRVADVMNAPPLIMPPSLTLREILGIMIQHKVSSVLIEPEEGSAPGIITERDILRSLDLQSEGALRLKAGAVASRPLQCVRSHDFLHRAISRMHRLGLRHLGVMDQQNRIVGTLSARDLLRQRTSDMISFGDALDQASTIEQLSDVWARLPLIVRSLSAEKIDPREIAAVISHELCNLTRRAAELAQTEIEAEEKAPQDVRFCVLVLGSGGRGESLLALDQDNAIVFDAGENESIAEAWLVRFAQRFNDILHELGVPLCRGGIMARNSAWRKSAAAWRAQVANWLSRSDAEDILHADIFFDAVAVYGEDALGEDLRRDAIAAAAESPGFLKLMALNAARMDNVLGWFGRLRTDSQGRIDLKRSGVMPVFSAARVLALKHGVAARSTAARLMAVRTMPDIPETLLDHLLEAHHLLLGMILDQQLRDLERGTKLSNSVALSELSAYEREKLRWSLEQIQSIEGLLGDPLG